MSRIITRVTRGRINTGSKKALVLIVSGMLYFGSTPTPPTPPSGGGGGYTYAESHNTKTLEERRKKIEEGNRFIIEFLKTATDIVNNQ